MILQELRDLADAAGWMRTKEFTDTTVHWLLRIDAEGNPLRDADGNLACWHRLTTDPPPGSRKKPKPGRAFAGAPKISRKNQSDIKPEFLVGRADRLLFATDEGSPAGKTRLETEKVIRQLAERSDELAIVAVDRFYLRCREGVSLVHELLLALKEQIKAEMPADRNESEKESLAADQAEREIIAFSLQSDHYQPVFSKANARKEWVAISQERSFFEAAGRDDKVPCLCCGETCSPRRIHEAKIKGLPGPGRTGASLIAYNKAAFQSHDLEDSLNAPMCARCVDAYTTALARLIKPSADTSSGPSFGGAREVAGVTFCYWCRDPLTQDPMLLPFDAPVKDVENLLESVSFKAIRRTL